eukprot:2387355-Pyramimonas_sp.AAC.1
MPGRRGVVASENSRGCSPDIRYMSTWKAGVERISRSPPEISLPRVSQSKCSSRGALKRSAKLVAWAS